MAIRVCASFDWVWNVCAGRALHQCETAAAWADTDGWNHEELMVTMDSETQHPTIAH